MFSNFNNNCIKEYLYESSFSFTHSYIMFVDRLVYKAETVKLEAFQLVAFTCIEPLCGILFDTYLIETITSNLCSRNYVFISCF